MGNNTQTAWTHALDGEALRAWLDFDVQRLGGGSLRLDWSEEQGWAKLMLKKMEDGKESWLALDDFWLEDGKGCLSTGSDNFGAAGWPKVSLFSGAALAFCGGFCIDEGIGRYYASTRIHRPDFNQVAAEIGSTGAFFTKKWASAKMTKAQEADVVRNLVVFYGKEALAAMGWDKNRMSSRAEPTPWAGARGWGKVVESRREDIVGASKAGDWLLPFCSLLGEAPPKWLVEQAGAQGVKRALSAALLAGNMDTVKMLAHKARLGMMDGGACVNKAFRPWDGVFQDCNQNPHTSEEIAQKKAEALAIYEAATLGEEVDMARLPAAKNIKRRSSI